MLDLAVDKMEVDQRKMYLDLTTPAQRPHSRLEERVTILPEE
jgi:hypothetical protein